MKNLNFIIICIILTVVSVFCLAVYLPSKFDNTSAAQMSAIPKEIGEWKSTDITIDEKSYQILETRNLIMREYKNSMDQKVVLYIIYSEENSKVVHPPELCYSGGGNTIVQKSVEELVPGLKANRMTVEDRNSREIVYYLFKGGKNYNYNYLKQQLQIILNLLQGKKTSSAMIRISTGVKDNNDKAAIEIIKQFTKKIKPLVDKYVP